MNQDKIEQISELEFNFKKFLEMGHPNVVDNGFFIDAVFNVTSYLKQQGNSFGTGDENRLEMDESLHVLMNLYQSLKDFERLYSTCLTK